jgi:hypothetical protein
MADHIFNIYFLSKHTPEFVKIKIIKCICIFLFLLNNNKIISDNFVMNGLLYEMNLTCRTIIKKLNKGSARTAPHLTLNINQHFF